MTATSRIPTVLLSLLLGLALVLPPTQAGAQVGSDPEIAYEVISELTNEPLVLEIAPDGRLIWAQRDGALWVMTPEGVQVLAAVVPVAANLCLLCPPDQHALTNRPNRLGIGGLEEGGLHGLLLAEDFAETGRLYLYRSVPDSRDPETTLGVFRLSSFVLDPQTNLLDLESEEPLLEVPAEWDHCCHYGGDLDLLPDGTITVTTGDDVEAAASDGYGPRDHRTIWTNAEITSANPADRRGKILRLMPDGSVPDGSQPGIVANPFIGMEGYIPATLSTEEEWVPFDPYVYSMGWKQPWRAVVHPETGTMYVSDIGPDSGFDDPDRGPRGLEEINVVPMGGGTHHGWPRCIGPNLPYTDVNWETGEVGDPLDCSDTALVARPIGSTDESTWVRGMAGAPFYYPSGASEEWPIVGTGGKTSEPVAFYPASTTGPLRLPATYDDRLIVLEWSRNYILTIPYRPDGTLDLRNEVMRKMTPPSLYVSPDLDNPAGTVSAQQGRLMAPVDGKVGPDGAFYFLEYGGFYYAGANGRLSRIRCADCAPADPAANYGLPVDGGVVAPALGAAVSAGVGVGGNLPAMDRTLLVTGLALALGAVVWRRRRHLA